MAALTHGSLFSGIGGIDLGFRWAGISTAWQVEKDEYARRVLQKHWPKLNRFTDVRDCGRHNLPPVDVISAGFPCQDVSSAGRKRGLAGERSGLWVEFARIVRELRSPWVLIENVAALKHNGADEILSDLEAAGYSCWPLLVGAEALGAPHRRERVWVLCHRDAHSHRHFGTGVAGGWPLPPDAEGAMAQAHQGWDRGIYELGARTGVPGPDAYSRIVRDAHGIPAWVDRLRSLGNAVIPQIPMLIGCFIRQQYEHSLTKGKNVQTSPKLFRPASL